jgi:protein tyrosine phosphatase (PTP) superfamily phosphohydrolase (DUF442 family)
VTKSAYHVKRLVSGATGTNTINIYSPLGFDAKSEIEPPASLAAAVEVELEEAAFDIDLEPTEELLPNVAVAETSLEAHVSATPEPRLALTAGLRIDLEPYIPRDDEIDAQAMAEAMKEAARLGMPFCEECTRARLRLAKTPRQERQPEDDIDAQAMARAMKEAARQGVPFCEECTRARLRQERERARK